MDVWKTSQANWLIFIRWVLHNLLIYNYLAITGSSGDHTHPLTWWPALFGGWLFGCKILNTGGASKDFLSIFILRLCAQSKCWMLVYGLGANRFQNRIRPSWLTDFWLGLDWMPRAQLYCVRSACFHCNNPKKDPVFRKRTGFSLPQLFSGYPTKKSHCSFCLMRYRAIAL